jgi:hypothetical protein
MEGIFFFFLFNSHILVCFFSFSDIEQPEWELMMKELKPFQLKALLVVVFARVSAQQSVCIVE